MGTTAGSWAARIPDVRAAVGLGEAGWGLANTATTAGSLTSLALVTVLIGRVGARRLALIGSALMLVNAPFMAGATSVVALVAGLSAWGFAANLLSTPMNAQAVTVERRYRRPIMSTFHAGFSVGMLVGGLLGTVAASAGIAPGGQLAATSVLLGVLLAATHRWLPPDDPAAVRRTGRSALRARFSPRLRLLAVIAFLASFTQGAATQWSAIYTSETLAAGAAAGAAAFTCVAVAETLARFGGDRLIARTGRVRFLRLSTAVGGGGVALALLGGTTATAFVGFALLGLGMGCVLPTVFGLAGDQPGLTPGEGIAVAVLGQWPAFLVAPVLIGSLAGAVGLRHALFLLVGVALAASVLAGRLRPPASTDSGGGGGGGADSAGLAGARVTPGRGPGRRCAPADRRSRSGR